MLRAERVLRLSVPPIDSALLSGVWPLMSSTDSNSAPVRMLMGKFRPAGGDRHLAAPSVEPDVRSDDLVDASGHGWEDETARVVGQRGQAEGGHLDLRALQQIPRGGVAHGPSDRARFRGAGGRREQR